LRPAGQYDRARQCVEHAVREHAEAWAKATGLTDPAAPGFAQFRDDVTEALHACLRAHLVGPERWRRSDVAKKLKRIAELATTPAPRLLELQALLDELLPLFAHAPSFRLPPLSPIAFDLSDQARATLDPQMLKRKARREPPPPAPSLAAAARCYAKAFSDTGGASKKYPAFDALLFGESVFENGLAHAYQRATGRDAKVTWSGHRNGYEGRFLALVEAVLPVAHDIAEKVTGRALACPDTKQARGNYIYNATRAGAGGKKRQRPPGAKRTR
jgi:hypothetical protein